MGLDILKNPEPTIVAKSYANLGIGRETSRIVAHVTEHFGQRGTGRG